jgi:16S rRNA (cytosine967-C5)-methyltransferase
MMSPSRVKAPIIRHGVDVTPSARVSAAIDVLADIETRRRPAGEALKDWGLAHRFAGSGDRSALAGLVYDALRVKASAAFVMGEDTPRAVMLGALSSMRAFNLETIAKLCSGDRFAPAPLSVQEGAALTHSSLDEAPLHVRGNFPEWLQEPLNASFGAHIVEETAAFAARAPVDLRVNRLKSLRPKILDALAHFEAQATPHSPDGVRILPPLEGKAPAVQAEPAFIKGQIEIQDEGSQLVAMLSGATSGEQVLDYCAGAGGKTLALSAMMNNKGQIFATDSDARRLAPIHERLERSGARNVQVRTPRGKAMPLEDLDGKMDLVLIDAPCTGTGTWRRNPDAKWRIRPGALAERVSEQTDILNDACHFVKPGGRLAYITCSVLEQENDAQIDQFNSAHPEFEIVPAASVAMNAALPALAAHATRHGIMLSPFRTGTDGFYCCLMVRKN